MNPLGILATLVTISLVPPCESDRQPALICPLVCSEEISKLRTSGMLSPLDHFLLQRVIEHLRVGNTLEARKCMEKMDSTKFEKDILLVLIAKCQAHRADQALQTIDSIRSASRKAQAILEVATVQLKCGNRKAAVALVDAIKLTSCSDVKRLMDNRGFDLQKPETWGIQYELDGITLFAVQDSEEKASAVAVAALRFTWALQGRRRNHAELALAYPSFPRLVVRKLAEAQVKSGDLLNPLCDAFQLQDARQRNALLCGILDGCSAKSNGPHFRR